MWLPGWFLTCFQSHTHRACLNLQRLKGVALDHDHSSRSPSTQVMDLRYPVPHAAVIHSTSAYVMCLSICSVSQTWFTSCSNSLHHLEIGQGSGLIRASERSWLVNSLLNEPLSSQGSAVLELVLDGACCHIYFPVINAVVLCLGG